jgi:hypothetical protein
MAIGLAELEEIHPEKKTVRMPLETTEENLAFCVWVPLPHTMFAP